MDEVPDLVVLASSPEAIAQSEHPTVKAVQVEEKRWKLVYPPALFTTIETTAPYFDPQEPGNRTFQSPLRIKGGLEDDPLIQLQERLDEEVICWLDEWESVEIP